MIQRLVSSRWYELAGSLSTRLVSNLWSDWGLTLLNGIFSDAPKPEWSLVQSVKPQQQGACAHTENGRWDLVQSFESYWPTEGLWDSNTGHFSQTQIWSATAVGWTHVHTNYIHTHSLTCWHENDSSALWYLSRLSFPWRYSVCLSVLLLSLALSSGWCHCQNINTPGLYGWDWINW